MFSYPVAAAQVARSTKRSCRNRDLCCRGYRRHQGFGVIAFRAYVAQRPHTNSLGNEICAMLVTQRNQVACRGLEGSCNPMETFLMRSQLAISALVVTSLFGSTLIASAQTQPAPGMSNNGTVSPGASSGKKTQHEKGMTTGSSTRSGSKKGDAANPSGQGNVDPDNIATPKSGETY